MTQPTPPTPLQQTLCSMLPYDLYVMRPDNKTFLKVEGIDWYSKSIVFVEGGEVKYGDMEKGKPIFRRLSVQEIYSICSELMLRKEVRPVKIFIEKVKTGTAEYWQMDILFKYHFNAFNLPEGQFIPVTKEFNPY